MELLKYLATFLCGFFLNYIIKYSEEKAKNKAQREDIGAITKIVESIKTDLAQKTEQLKANWSFINQNHLNLNTAKREAMINLSNKISVWYNSVIHFQMFGFSIDNYKEQYGEVEQLNKLQYEFELAQTNLGIFYEDAKLDQLIQDVKLKLILMQTKLRVCCTKIHGMFSINEMERKVAAPEKVLVLMKQVQESYMNEGNEYYKKLLENVAEITPPFEQINRMIRSEIKDFFKQENP